MIFYLKYVFTDEKRLFHFIDIFTHNSLMILLFVFLLLLFFLMKKTVIKFKEKIYKKIYFYLVVFKINKFKFTFLLLKLLFLVLIIVFWIIEKKTELLIGSTLRMINIFYLIVFMNVQKYIVLLQGCKHGIFDL